MRPSSHRPAPQHHPDLALIPRQTSILVHFAFHTSRLGNFGFLTLSSSKQVESQEKAKQPKGRAHKRALYTARFVNATLTGGKRRVCLPSPLFVSLVMQHGARSPGTGTTYMHTNLNPPCFTDEPQRCRINGTLVFFFFFSHKTSILTFPACLAVVSSKKISAAVIYHMLSFCLFSHTL